MKRGRARTSPRSRIVRSPLPSDTRPVGIQFSRARWHILTTHELTFVRRSPAKFVAFALTVCVAVT